MRVRPKIILFSAALSAACWMTGCSGSSSGQLFGGNHDPEILSLDVIGATPVTATPTPSATASPSASTSAASASTVDTEQINIGSTIVLICKAKDRDADPMTFAWTGGVTPTATDGNSSTATYNPTTVGMTTVVCRVSDNRNGVTARAVNIVAVDSSAKVPPKLTLTPASTTVAPSGTLSLTATASNSSGDPITFSYFTSSGTISAGTTTTSNGTSASVSTFTAPSTAGSAQIVCVASDSEGSSVALVKISVQ